jgi:hypothetical protein
MTCTEHVVHLRAETQYAFQNRPVALRVYTAEHPDQTLTVIDLTPYYRRDGENT